MVDVAHPVRTGVVPGHLGSRSVGVKLSEVAGSSLRLEASAYALEAKRAVAELSASPHQLMPLLGVGGLCQDAHNAFRFARIFVNSEHGVPFLSSSDIIGLRPERGRYLSKKHTRKLDDLRIKPWSVLVSCSGTIGNISLASPRMSEWALSQHVIRISTLDRDTAGYVTAFLRSFWGRAQLQGLTYGSVVQHIEPAHLEQVVIPDLPAIQRIAIGRAFVDAALNRDAANDKLDQADTVLRKCLGFPALPEQGSGPVIGKIRASQWDERLDPSYHSPQAQWVLTQLDACCHPVLPLADKTLTQAINAVTKFRKRVYVENGGIPLLSSKQLFQISPVEIKGLAKGAHRKDMAEIALMANTLAVTCSGTIGRVQIIPSYMGGWAANQHALRIIPRNKIIAGYLYAWLSSEYGQTLIKRFSYGSVIVEIDRFMIGQVPVPILPESELNAIGKLVLEANGLRDAAWQLEQSALASLSGQIKRTINERQQSRNSIDQVCL